jgi:signal transduction histidine kinase
MGVLPAKGARSALLGLVQPGRIEVVLATLLAALILVLDLPTHRLSAVPADLAACVVAAATARWPRAAGALLGAILLGYLMAPNGWATMGEYALLIPILGTGMRGQFRIRAWMSAAYFVILAAYAVKLAPTLASAMLGWVVWASLFAVLWLIGNTFHAFAEAQRQARTAEMVLQRQVLARELHDTVARSFTHVTMAAERALLRGVASAEDLKTISDEAAKGVDELRWVMTLLSDPATSVDALAAGRTSLAEALAAAQESLLAEHFQVSVSLDGDLERLDTEASMTLAAVTAEATANIVKHGDRDRPCAVVVQVGDQVGELSFINTPAVPSGAGSTAKHLGVWGMRQRLEPLGGEVVAAAEDGLWVTRVTLPLAQRRDGGVHDG